MSFVATRVKTPLRHTVARDRSGPILAVSLSWLRPQQNRRHFSLIRSCLVHSTCATVVYVLVSIRHSGPKSTLYSRQATASSRSKSPAPFPRSPPHFPVRSAHASSQRKSRKASSATQAKCSSSVANGLASTQAESTERSPQRSAT